MRNYIDDFGDLYFEFASSEVALKLDYQWSISIATFYFDDDLWYYGAKQVI